MKEETSKFLVILVKFIGNMKHLQNHQKYIDELASEFSGGTHVSHILGKCNKTAKYQNLNSKSGIF